MKVFVTGATGYCGAPVVKLLLAEGHHVVGLVRSEASAERLRKAGGEPLTGTVDDLDVLAKAAAAADGVIHTAFRHDGSVPYTDACKIDCAAIKAMTDAMAGTDKPFVMSSGTGVVGETGPQPVTEEFPIDPEHALATRVSTERAAVVAAGRGVRASVLRLPMYVWGNNGSYFIPLNIAAAKQHGKAHYILPGSQQTSGVHVDDLARLYVLALKHAPAGTVYFATTSNNSSARSIAEACASNAGVGTEGISYEDAIAQKIWPDWVASLYVLNNRADSTKAEKMLGWGDFKNTDMLADIVSGSYAAKA
ncbi:hypothetical protein CVIRNUC_010966 [Coccomyxa viridis]|uniref:NAD-dependent epimerase/dehydratase domain-containing protein n=1 Tax=Coccomyxa viridis TaxID=1274662 RepID=A0AAV1IP48_9CHLO|nr:hypothetical protein CVIRNUC_010966 [Coccomyxa viridis]